MSAYAPQTAEGLRKLAETLTTSGPAPLCCPECGGHLLIQFSAINSRWSARHPRPSSCRLGLACWGVAETEDQLRQQFAAGTEPRVSNPETVALVTTWVLRLAGLNDRRNRDR